MRRQLGAAPSSNAVDALRLTDLGTKTKGSALSGLTGQAVAAGDLQFILDVSDTSQGAAGSWKNVSMLEQAASVNRLLGNASTARVINGAGASDTYLTGSFNLFPAAPLAKTKYRCKFDVTKTAAGTATPIIIVRIGTAGTTADAAICTFTFAAGTAAADYAEVDIEAVFRTVGSGTSAVLVGKCRAVTNLTTTGWSNAVKGRVAVSSGFNSTTASIGIGASYNGGTGAVHTIEQVTSELIY